MRQKRFGALSALLSSIAVPVASALEGPDIKDVGQAIAMVGKALHGIFNDEYALYFVTILFAFLLFYIVYAAPARRLRFFEGQGGLGLNRLGQLFCVALAGLTCTAIFAFRDNVVGASKRFLTPFGLMGALVFSILIFILVWRGFRDQRFLGLGNFAMGLAGGILAWLFFAYLAGNENLLGFGILFLGFFLFALLFRGFLRLRHHGISRWAVRGTERAQAREARTGQQLAAQEGQESAQELAALRAENEALRRNETTQDLALDNLLQRLQQQSRNP